MPDPNLIPTPLLHSTERPSVAKEIGRAQRPLNM